MTSDAVSPRATAWTVALGVTAAAAVLASMAAWHALFGYNPAVPLLVALAGFGAFGWWAPRPRLAILMTTLLALALGFVTFMSAGSNVADPYAWLLTLVLAGILVMTVSAGQFFRRGRAGLAAAT